MSESADDRRRVFQPTSKSINTYCEARAQKCVSNKASRGALVELGSARVEFAHPVFARIADASAARCFPRARVRYAKSDVFVCVCSRRETLIARAIAEQVTTFAIGKARYESAHFQNSLDDFDAPRERLHGPLDSNDELLDYRGIRIATRMPSCCRIYCHSLHISRDGFVGGMVDLRWHFR